MLQSAFYGVSVFPEFVAVQRKASTAEAGGKGAAGRQNATSARPCVLTGGEMAELAPDYYLFRVAIVSATVDALRSMAQSLADAHARGDLSDTQTGDIELVHLPVDKSLVAGTARHGLLADVLGPPLAQISATSGRQN